MGVVHYLILFSNLFLLSFGQQCQNFSSFTPWTSSPSVCSTILPQNYQVYVNDTTCLKEIEQDVASRFPSIWFSLSSSCRIALSKYQCLVTYPGCENQTNVNISVAPCQSICDDVSQKCNNPSDEEILSLNGISLGNCSSSSPCQTIPDPTTVPIPQCDSYRGTACAGVINYPIYIPPTSSQAILESHVASLTRVFAIAPRDNDCQKYTAAYFCSQTFMECDTGVMGRANASYANNPSMQIPFPRYPCKSVCLDFNSSCAGLFALEPALIPNCNAYGKAPDARRQCNGSYTNQGQDNFPVSETIYENTSLVLSSQCDPLPVSTFSATASAFGDCPFPLVQPDDYDHVDKWIIGSCALPCPLFTSSKEENRRQDLLWTSLSFLSFFYFPIVALPYFLFPAKRKHFPVVNLFICAIGGTIGPFSGVFKGPPQGDPRFIDLSFTTSSLRCINNALAYNSENSSLCFWMYMVGTIGGIGVTCWWLIIAADLFSQIVMEKKSDWSSRNLKIGCVVYGWGLPVIAFILAISLGDSPQVSATGSWDCGLVDKQVLWGAVMGPMIWNIGFGCPLMFMTIVKVIKVARNAGRIPTESLRLLFLLFFFFSDFAYTFIGNGIVYNDTPKVKTAATVWLTCLLKYSSPGVNPLEKCGTEPSYNLSPELLRPFCALGASTGIILAGLFTDFNVFRTWIYFFSAPNRFSLTKMTDSNISTMIRRQTMSHQKESPTSPSQSSKQPIELVKVETSLLHETKPETSVEDTEQSGDKSASPSRVSTRMSKDEHRALFNPFNLESSPHTRNHSFVATPTKERRTPPESPTSAIDNSISGIDSPSFNPLFFQLPSVSEQPLETSERGQSSETLPDSQTTETLPDSQQGSSPTPLVPSTSTEDNSPMEQSS